MQFADNLLHGLEDVDKTQTKLTLKIYTKFICNFFFWFVMSTVISGVVWSIFPIRQDCLTGTDISPYADGLTPDYMGNMAPYLSIIKPAKPRRCAYFTWYPIYSGAEKIAIARNADSCLRYICEFVKKSVYIKIGSSVRPWWKHIWN